MAIGIDTAFDSGALGEILELGERRVVARIARDWDQERLNTQATWYHVRLSGLAGRPCELVLTDLGGVYNGRPNSGGLIQADQPFVSDDGRHWRKSETATFDESARTYTIALAPAGDVLHVATLEPYVAADLARLAAALAPHPAVRQEVCGQTVEGRDLALWTIGAESAARCVWVMARQHAWETHTSWCLEGLARWLVSEAAAAVREACCFKLLPMVDPDGVKAGASRFNRLGYDVNRHWDETDPSNPEHRRLRPEISAAKGALADWLAAGGRCDCHLNLHDTQVDFMSVDQPLADHPVAQGVHERICDARFDGPLRGSTGGPTGVAEVALYREFGVVAALIELGTTRLESYGRHPTAADRLAFGAALGQALAEAVSA